MATGEHDEGRAEDRTGGGAPPGSRGRGFVSATATGARRAGAATGRGANRAFLLARRASHSGGAGESGLYRLIEMHAFGAAGDAAVAISLAGTLFFQAPTGEARGHVALFLGLTMLPFAVVAPLIGPFLDRLSHGRRWAIGATMAARAVLCLVLAGAIADESLTMFPAALGVLVASKAYGVTRAAAVPRVTPPELGLVKANSRMSLSGICGASISAPLAVLAAMVGPDWSLRYAFVLFSAATVLAILLPPQVDNAAGEERADFARRGRVRVPKAVVVGLRGNSGLRLLSGFLTLYMAFLLRDKPFDGWESRPALLIGLVIGSAGLGNTVGILLGNLLKRVRPQRSVMIALFAATAATLVASTLYALPTVLLLALTAGLAQSFGKLSLDSLIQREVPDSRRASTFAKSETLLQLSWVIGGFIGIALPLIPRLGIGVAAALMLAACAWAVSATRRPEPAPAPDVAQPAAMRE
jgi:MFS family permease